MSRHYVKKLEGQSIVIAVEHDQYDNRYYLWKRRKSGGAYQQLPYTLDTLSVACRRAQLVSTSKTAQNQIPS
jgi:hypothetical protein